MEIQRINTTEIERQLVSSFMGEEYPQTIDFNWLMPVVEKIESDKGIHFQICEKECNIWNMPKLEPIVFTESSTKIEAVYNAVIKFIEWYNNKKI